MGQSVSTSCTVPQGRGCQLLDPQKERFIYISVAPCESWGGPYVFPPHAEIPHSYTGTWACNPISSSTTWIPPGNVASLEATVGKETLEQGQATATQLGESNVSPYTVSLCTGAHAEGLFMNSGKYLFWKIHTSKENTLIDPLNRLAVLALMHAWTLLLARTALISACRLQKQPSFWTVFSAESQSWRRQG